MPTASTITIAETLDLLDGPQNSFSAGFQAGQYALWLGSGISRERVVGLDGVLSKLLENLRLRVIGADCEHHRAFDKILGLADLSADERAQVDLAQPVGSWPIHDELIDRLWNKYSKVLGTEVQGRPFDYLLWDAGDSALRLVEAIKPQRRAVHDPAVYGGIIDVNAAFSHHLFDDR